MLLIKGIIMILLAILILSSPAGALLTYVIYIGIGFSITGIVRIIQGFQAKGVSESWKWIVFEGVIDLFVGFILMAHPGVTAAILPWLIGFWAAIYGFSLIIDAFSGKGNAGMKVITGILIVGFAFVIMFHPLLMGMTLVVWIGIMLLVAGIFNVIAAFGAK